MPLILTFAEVRDGKLRRSALEAVSEARRLADALAGTVRTVLIGSGVKALAGELWGHASVNELIRSVV